MTFVACCFLWFLQCVLDNEIFELPKQGGGAQHHSFSGPS